MGLSLDVRPGFYYDVTATDKVAVGTRWAGGKLVQKGARPLKRPKADAGPLEPTYRRRLIVKLDDLQDFALVHFQRVVKAIGDSGGTADLGINPGRCEPALWDWLRTLDPSRFEVWNHTWDHGAEGPKLRDLPLDVQYEHIDMVQRRVKEHLGRPPRAFGQPGIRYRDGWIGDQDEVTYLAVRMHPDLVAIYDGGRTARKLGLQNEMDPLFDPVALSSFESPPGDWDRGDMSQRYRLAYVAEKYPDEDPMRPPICGNAEELKWRVDHPSTDMEAVDRQGGAYVQFHPWFWKLDSDVAALGEWVSYVIAQGKWRFSNCYHAFKWWRDKPFLGMEKIAPDRYRLDARVLRFEHKVELALPADSRIDAKAWTIPIGG